MRKIMLIIMTLMVPIAILTNPAGAMAQKPSGNKGNTETVTVEKSRIIRDNKENKLKFIDKNGRNVKEFTLGREKEKIVKKKHLGIEGEVMINEQLNRDATISKDNKFALIIEDLLEYLVPENEEQKKAWDGTDAATIGGTGNIKYFNNEGNLLWEKQFPVGIEAGDYTISGNNEKIAVATVCNIFEYLSPEEPYERLFVYDKTGKEIFSFPENRNQGYRISASELEMSPNGKC